MMQPSIQSCSALLAMVLCCATVGAAAQESPLISVDLSEAGSSAIQQGIAGEVRFHSGGPGGYAIFNGRDSAVQIPIQALHKNQVTLCAWVFAESLPDSERGIAGMGMDGYQLTFYRNGQVYFYAGDGSNHCTAMLSRWAWHHVAGTFDGTSLSLFIDGKRVRTLKSSRATVFPQPRLTVGALDRNSGFFQGKVAGVQVYDRALSDGEIEALLGEGKARFGSQKFQEEQSRCSLGSPGLTITATESGGAIIIVGGTRYYLASAFASSGEDTSWYALGAISQSPLQAWTTASKAVDQITAQITGESDQYSFTREIRLDNAVLHITDTYTGKAAEPVGLTLVNELTAENEFDSVMPQGAPENPTLFASNSAGGLGIAAVDNVLRLRFEPVCGVPQNRIGFRASDLSLRQGQKIALRWSVHLLEPASDYFGFVNKLRRAWNSNTRIDGPFTFFDIVAQKRILEDPEKLRSYLQRSGVRVVALLPWLDYDPGAAGKIWSREEFKREIQRIVTAFHTADPSVKVLGCIECDWVNIDRAAIPGGDALPRQSGEASENIVLTPEQVKLLEGVSFPWRDSLKRNRDGRVSMELYTRANNPLMSLPVFPAPGNHQHEFLLEQVKFLLDNVGMDGFYIDEFNQAFMPDHFGMGDDGISAQVNPVTGRIEKPLLDWSLAGVDSRVALANLAIARGKTMFANTYATSEQEQQLPVMRFAETFWMFDAASVELGNKPELIDYLLRGTMGTPLGLGSKDTKGDTGQLLREVIVHLRHGNLYNYYFLTLDDSSNSVPGCELVRSMYPITPESLGCGWIQGRERVISAVSRDFTWKGPNAPRCRIFGERGVADLQDSQIHKVASGWRVSVTLRDWAEVAVIE